MKKNHLLLLKKLKNTESAQLWEEDEEEKGRRSRKILFRLSKLLCICILHKISNLSTSYTSIYIKDTGENRKIEVSIFKSSSCLRVRE